MHKVECVWNAHAKLGEGPMWSVKEQALYWVDILGQQLHRLGHGHQHSWDFDEVVTSVAERSEVDGLIVTLRHGFAYFDPLTEKLERLVAPEAHLPDNRFNDGKCDVKGRYWAGTIDFECKAPTGSLYRLDPTHEHARIDTGYPVTNGPAWSLDHHTMYFNDSANGRIFAFDFDPNTGSATNKRLFLQLAPDEGSPDGMTTDAEGGLWIAQWGAGKVTRRDEKGNVLQTVELPVSQVSSCAFGGRDLKTLYMTSARTNLSEEQLEREPLAGGLFAVELDIPGLPAHRFAG